MSSIHDYNPLVKKGVVFLKANQMIRDTAKKKGVKQWQIAEYLGISEPTITRWLRVSLSPEREKAIMDAIEAVGKEEC